MNITSKRKYIRKSIWIYIWCFLLLVLTTIYNLNISFLIFDLLPKTQAQTTGLLVYWPLDSTSGTVAYDASGNNRDGTLINNPVWTSGKINNALSFNGTNSYVRGVDIDFPSAPFTIALWFKTADTGTRHLTAKAGSWTSINWDIWIENGYIWGSLYDGNHNGVQDTRRTYNDNVWHHVALVVDSSKLELFVDGTSAGSKTHDNSFPTNDTPFTVGGVPFFNSYFNGQIDDFRIYNRNLSSSEILSLYNISSADTQPPTVPTNLTATVVSSSQINLSWSASTDNVGVAGYKIYRNGAQITTVTGTSYQDKGLSPSTTYTYAVSAYDVSGNTSSLSQSVQATTQSISSSPTIALNPSLRYQTIESWFAHGQAGQDYSTSTYILPLYRDTLVDLAVNDLGLTGLMVEVRSGAENTRDYWDEYQKGLIDYQTWRCLRYTTINDNSDPNTINWSGFKFSELDRNIRDVVLPFKQKVESSGQKFYLFLRYGDVPGQRTASGCPTPPPYVHSDPQEYAEFILATILYMKNNYNIVPDFIDVINEPDGMGSWNATQIGQAIVATAAKLQSNGFNIKFFTPSTADTGHGWIYFDWMIQNVPSSLQYLDSLSYHLYGGVTDSNRQQINQRRIKYGIRTAQTEKIGADYNELYKDLTIANNSFWTQYTLAWPGADNGGAYYNIDISNINSPKINMGSRTKFLRQYFRYVKQKAVRIDATSTDPNFQPVAFINPNGKYVVVVNATSSGSFSIGGLPSGVYGISYTTASQYDVNLPDVNLTSGLLTVTIPSAGVMTIYGKTTQTPSDTQPPTAPTNLIVTAISSSTINLSWSASTDNVGVAGYIVERCQGSGCTNFTQIATPNTTSYSDNNLLSNTSYSYRVKAVDTSGNQSTYSNIVSATTFVVSADTQPPTAPTNLTATAVSSSQINLSWSASQDNVGVAGYKIYRCQNSGCTPTNQIATSTLTSYSDQNLSPQTTYVYAVSAYDSANNVSSKSQTVSATTPQAPTTGQVSNLNVLGTTHTQAVISYTAPDSNACKIEVSESPTFSPLVHDVNGKLFPGADMDNNRVLNPGTQRIVVIGKRTSDKAVDGKLYSRALAAYTQYFVRVTCGSSSATTSFTTQNLPWRDTFTHLPPFNPDGFGNYAWPSIDWTNRDGEYIDPMTGVKVKLLAWPGDANPRRWENTFSPDYWWDWGGAWSNAQNITSGNTTALSSVTADNKPIFVGIDPVPGGPFIWGGVQVVYAGFGIDRTIDDVGLHIYGSGTDSNSTNRTIRICLSIDSGQSCYGSAVDVVLPQGTAVDNGVFPKTFPSPLFASWPAPPLKRVDWPHSGQVTVSGNTVNLVSNVSGGGIDDSSFFQKWVPGTKIWISGTNPTCPHNLCTITAVQSQQQLTIRESLNISTPTLYKSMHFGFRIVKTTPVGTINVSTRPAFAASNVTYQWAGGAKQACSLVKTVTNVDRNGNPLPRPLSGYLCILPQNGALDAFSPIWWVSEETGEVRVIAIKRHDLAVYAPGTAFGDQVRIGAASPNGQTGVRFDPKQGNVWYDVYETNTSGKISIFKITYTGDFREYKPNYPAGSYPPIPWVWENLSKPSEGRDLFTQIDNAGIPGWDPSKFGGPIDCRLAISTAIVCGKNVAGQDSPGWMFLFGLDGTFIKGFNSWDGKVFPGLRWSGVHSFGGRDIPPTTASPGFTSIALNILAFQNPARLLGGPFETQVTAIKRSTGWDTTDTSLSSTVGDSSYDSTCPSDISPKWQKWIKGNNCVQIRLQGEACSAFPSANEKSWWPCPWDSNRSTMAGNKIEEGDFMYDPGNQWGSDSERFMVVKRTDLPGGQIELVVIRHMPTNYTCGNLTAQRVHSNGWKVRMALPWGCGEANAQMSVAPGDNTIYFSKIFGHSDAGVGATNSTVKAAAVTVARISGPADYVLGRPDEGVDIGWNRYPGFDGTGIGGGGGGLQSYPSLAQFNAIGEERYWMLDNNHIEAAGYNTTMSLESGQKYTYRMTIPIGATSGGIVDIKRNPIVAWSGHYLLKDISGPGSLISDATPWTYCYAYKPGECRPGSSVGQFFVSAPNAKIGTACSGFAVYSETDQSVVPCAFSGGFATMGSWTVQRLLDFGNGQYFRRITMGFSGHNRQVVFMRSDAMPEGKWIRVPGYWLDGIRTDFLLVKMPPVSPLDDIDRSKYQTVSIQLPPVSGASKAVVDFGYEEFGSKNDFYCTPRNERCTVPGLTPFSYASESITPAPCDNGCTINVPAIDSYVLYYRARYFDNAGNLISTSPLSALAVRGSGQTIVVPPPTQDTQPPTVPTNLTATAVSSSQINLSWSASTDNVGVAGYIVERCQGSGCTNFTQIATPNTTSYSDNNLLSNTSYSYRVKAVDTSGNQSAYSNIASATTPAGTADTQPPTVSITSPLNGATVSGVITVSAVATDNVGVAGVQFKLDGVNLGNEILNAPYSVQWDTTKTNNGGHTLTAVARDSSGNIATSSIGVNVSNPTSGGTSQTIIVSLSASPQSGPAPLTSIIRASVSGTAVGPINYTFYCNRHDSKTNITPDYNFKLDNSSLTIATTTCIYSSPGNYVAKVIVERGSATPVEQRITIKVSSSSKPPKQTILEQSSITTTSIEQVRKPPSPQQKSVIISTISSVLQETTNIIQSTARLDFTSRRAILTQIQNLIMLISNLLLQLQKI